MAYKSNQEHSSYMDGVKVKISERYKPPPKITLPMAYSQRIEVNKQIRDNIPIYNFSLERTVKEKMKEWKEAREKMIMEQKERIERIKEAKEKEKNIEIELRKKKTDEEDKMEKGITTKSENDFSNNYNNLRDSSMLKPTQANANILTPTPLGNLTLGSYTCKTVDKSPFNISDFDPDTSSPFDNMALKTINDMAELALVLQNEEKIIPTSSLYSYNNPAVYTQTYPNNTQSYLYQPSTSSNAYNFPNSTNNTYQTTTITTPSNGLLKYYDHLNPNFGHPINYGKMVDNNIKINNTVQLNSTVPDIMKALQTEIDNKYLNLNNVTSINKSSQLVDSLLQNEAKVEDETFKNMPGDLQKMAKEINSMGFPLDRVIRVCKIIGDDHKKIVEHLLALSDLLDLGFPEQDVSKALLECNNDRDKALDRLIL
ncbi:ubiquitin-associated protein 1 [Onthophagus taurus]|uniref:ubiquitin-associated protein 1 n=1 Tax=Onthophagus taurus TaxID=166361 RepID=UPI000C206D9A|nr:putative uncharacterized protein DDB_G0282133 [Onthophagus taurus]